MDYHLKPVGKTCAATGKDLTPGAPCISVLLEENGRLTRLDYSEEGWNGPPEGTVGYWRTTVPESSESKSSKLDTDALMRYFEQLSEDANPAQDKFRYVLALLLLQKRRLRLEGVRRDGDIEYLEMTGSRSEGPFEVPDHHLDDEEIGQIQHDLNAHLATEWN